VTKRWPAPYGTAWICSRADASCGGDGSRARKKEEGEAGRDRGRDGPWLRRAGRGEEACVRGIGWPSHHQGGDATGRGRCWAAPISVEEEETGAGRQRKRRRSASQLPDWYGLDLKIDTGVNVLLLPFSD
jgi:hypothetical protein